MIAKKYRTSTFLTGGLVAGLWALAVLQPAYAAVPLNPKTDWAVTKIDRSQQGGQSYCTLSRQYDEGVVLSVARNVAEEYSLAIDFQKDRFTQGAPVKIHLEPGPGKLRAYDLMPVSEKAVVIRLGWDDGFFSTLSESRKMKVTIDDQAFEFSMPDVKQGQGDLETCMIAMQDAARSQTATAQQAASSPSAPADILSAPATRGGAGFGAGRIDPSDVASDMAAAKEDVAAQEGGAISRLASAADAQAPQVQPQQSARVANTNVNRNAAASREEPKAQNAASVASAAAPLSLQPDVSDVAAATVSASRETASERIESKAQPVKSAAAKSGEALAPKNAIAAPKVVASAPPVPRDPPAIAAPLPPPSSPTESFTASLTDAPPEPRLLALEQEKEKLERDLQALRQAQARQDQERSAAAQASQSLAKELEDLKTRLRQSEVAATKLTQENKNLQEQLARANERVAQRVQADQTSMQRAEADAAIAEGLKSAAHEAQQKIAALEQQNQALQVKLQQASAPVEIPATMSPPPPSASAADQAKLASAEARIKELEARNAQLEQNLQQAQAQASIGDSVINNEAQSLKRIADLELRLEAAQKDNAALARQMEEARNRQDDGRLTLASGNWDLEQATRRFNEAEREIRRLGLQLEQERTSCNREKAEIEQMLFDPAVAEQAQIRKMVTLEQQLAAARTELETYRRMAASNVQPGTLSLSGTPSSAGVGMSGQDIEALRQQNEQLRRETAGLRNQIADISSGSVSRADHVASAQLQVNDLRRQMAMKDNQILTYQNQIAALQRSAGSQGPVQAQAAAIGSQVGAPVAAAREIATITPAAGTVSTAGRGVQASASRSQSGGAPQAQPARYDVQSLQGLLQQAGLHVSGIQKASNGFPGAENYGWNGQNGVRGASSVRVMASPSEFDALVAQYIAHMEGLCAGGDFASMPSQAAIQSGRRMTTYETACVGGAKDGAASILFFEDQGRFIALVNEASAQDMDLAMDQRDRLVSALHGRS